MEYKQSWGIGDMELKEKDWAEQITKSCFSSFYLLKNFSQAAEESSDSEHMPSSDLGKQPVFQNRFETILLSCDCGVSIDGQNNFSNHHSGHLTGNWRKVPDSETLLTFGFRQL